MDSLDFNLHQSILTSLAGSYLREHQSQQQQGVNAAEINRGAGNGGQPDGANGYASSINGHAVMNQYTGPHIDTGSTDAISEGGSLVDMFGLSSKAIEQDTTWSFQDVNAAIAVAEYVSASAGGSSETYSEAQFAARVQTSRHGKQTLVDFKRANRERDNRTNKDAETTMLSILARLPHMRCSRALGANGYRQRWLSADQLAFALGMAAINLGCAQSHRESVVLLVDTYQKLKDSLSEVDNVSAVEHVLPAMHGISRAFAESAAHWPSSFCRLLEPIFRQPASETFEHLTTLLDGSFVHSSQDGRYILNALARYENLGCAMTANFAALMDMRILYSVTVRIAAGGALTADASWNALKTGSVKHVTKSESTDRTGSVELAAAAQARLTHYLQDYLAGSEAYVIEDHMDEILRKTLEATVAMSLNGQLDSAFLQLLLSLLPGDKSNPNASTSVELCILDCLSVLAQNLPHAAQASIPAVRHCVSSNDLLSLGQGGMAESEILVQTVNLLMYCLEVVNQQELTLSVLYSFLNYGQAGRADIVSSISGLDGSDAPNGSLSMIGLSLAGDHESSAQGGKVLLRSQALQAAVLMTSRIATVETADLTVNTLLQRVRMSKDDGTEAVAIRGLGTLGHLASFGDFKDVIALLLDVVCKGTLSRSSHSEEAALASLRKLANSAATKQTYTRELLHSCLSTIIEQRNQAEQVLFKVISGSRFSIERSHATLDDDQNGMPTIDSLLEIVHDLLLAADSKGTLKTVQDGILPIFRDFWFIVTILGLSSSANGRSALRRRLLGGIAARTPCLARDLPLNYVDTELEFNPLLRREVGQHADRLREDLSFFTPDQNAISARLLTYPRLVFLLTVAQTEAMRAESGDPSIMLEYLACTSMQHAALVSPFQEIARKCTAIFIEGFKARARNHTVDRSLPLHLSSMIRYCTKTYEDARSATYASLDSILRTFPILCCDPHFIVNLLETLTLVRDACEDEFANEYAPRLTYESQRGIISITVSDDYRLRNVILADLHRHARIWLTDALSTSPLEMTGLLQDYLDSDPVMSPNLTSGMGKSLALEIARSTPRSSREDGLPAIGGWKKDIAASFASAFGTRHTFGSEAKTVIGLASEDNGSLDSRHVQLLKNKLRHVSRALRQRSKATQIADLRSLLYRAAAAVIAKPELDYEILREIAFIPVHAINPPAMHLGVEVWAWLIDKRADVEAKLMVDLYLAWAWTVRRRRGMFSMLLKAECPILSKTEYSPTNIDAIAKASRTVRSILLPQLFLLEFLASRFQAFRYRDRYLVLGCLRMLLKTYQRHNIWGMHPLCREIRSRVVLLGFSILNQSRLETSLETLLRRKLYEAAFSWFEIKPTWSYGSDRLQMLEDQKALRQLAAAVAEDKRQISSSAPSALPQLLLLLIEDEIQRVNLWSSPVKADKATDAATMLRNSTSAATWGQLVAVAWQVNPQMACMLPQRFKHNAVAVELQRLILSDSFAASRCPAALDIYLKNVTPGKVSVDLLYWASVSPVRILQLLQPPHNTSAFHIQYAVRALEQHPVDLVFFYIPQVVQSLRSDPLHYVERFIFETSKISQLFCHQMIWNMKANCFKDDLAEVPDPDKALFESMVDLIISSLSGEAKTFFDKEFGFFNEVTSISRKLMPYVKKSKPEKKAKIDEEMAKIKVERGVYLPSHPEGTVIDIDRHSGRPLQSHAKTPFMATFYTEREAPTDYSEKEIEETGGEKTGTAAAYESIPSLQGGETSRIGNERQRSKLSAIFKVGDDCRQDVLALQVIAQFKNMFNVLGLDLQVQPYKVLATGPGTGIIDVVPNATSRDEMGRAKINDLSSYFTYAFGPKDSAGFQRARRNFVQSMAAYSVLCYILQIKDRHNGNIMIDGTGRLTHIDFGFLFDIDKFRSPINGIKFEPNSFKLTREMIELMGGSDSQGYRQYRELTVKAFLACRAYTDDVVGSCQLMISTDLPSFKGEGTMLRLRERFRPDLTELEAAEYMIGVIDNAAENSRSILYDRFQYMQNKIPYAK